MKKDTSIRDKAIEWWNGLSANGQSNYKTLYDIKGVSNYETIEHIYLSENPIPVNDNSEEGKEGFTGGEWHINKGKGIVYASIEGNNPPICTIHMGVDISKSAADANALLISNSPALYESLRELIKEVQAQYGKVYVPNSIFDKVEEAKEIINRINKH